MRADYKNTIKKLSGNTADIVSVVMETYNKDWKQVSGLAQEFKDSSARNTCKNIFDFIVKNVRYKEDPAGVQWVKTPARLLADGVGDCKSMSIFSASCLRVLGIDHFFRFVSFNRKKEATHVYVIAISEYGEKIILDPVVRPVQFNKEEKYTYKSDMRGTDIYYLSGIKRQHTPIQIGNINTNLWFGENPDDYSKHKMNLLSFMDLKLSESSIANSTKDLANIYNQLDMLSLAIYACENTTGRDDLETWFRHIAALHLQHAFSNSFTDLEARSRNLAMLKNTLQEHIYKYDYFSYDADLFAWLDANCLAHYEESISGIGRISKRQEAAKKIKESGIYYIYTFIPSKMEYKYPVRVLRKKQIQKNVYDWVDETDGYNSSAIQANLVRSGIISTTGKTPEQFLSGKNLKQFRISGVGSVTAVLGVISAVLSVVKLLWELFGNKRPKPTDEEINNGLSDFEVDFGNTSIPEIKPTDSTLNLNTAAHTTKSNNKFSLAAAGLATLFFIRKKSF